MTQAVLPCVMVASWLRHSCVTNRRSCVIWRRIGRGRTSHGDQRHNNLRSIARFSPPGQCEKRSEIKFTCRRAEQVSVKTVADYLDRERIDAWLAEMDTSEFVF
jgi:hypothetical protein